MSNEDIQKLKALAGFCKKVRRENELLRQQLGMHSQQLQEFDRENEDFFPIVHRNHALRAPTEVTFYFG